MASGLALGLSLGAVSTVADAADAYTLDMLLHMPIEQLLELEITQPRVSFDQDGSRDALVWADAGRKPHAP